MADTLTFSAKVGTLQAQIARSFPTDTSRANTSFLANFGGKLLASLSSAVNNNVVGGSDTVMQGVVTISASGNTTLDLTDFAELDGDANAAFARVKFIAFWLPAYATDNTIGSNATSVTIGNSGANAAELFLGANSHTITLKSGGWHIHSDPSAAGLTAGAGNSDLLITNNDGTNSAKLSYLLVGGSD